MLQKMRMPPREMRPTSRAPGVINGAPTMRQSTTATENARNDAATHSRPAQKRRGATCDAQMTDAITRDDRKKRGGRRAKCGRHLVPSRAPGVINGAPTIRQSTTATENARNDAATHSRLHKKRRGATCDARMTGETTRNDRKNADAAARNAADTLCPHGHRAS